MATEMKTSRKNPTKPAPARKGKGKNAKARLMFTGTEADWTKAPIVLFVDEKTMKRHVANNPHYATGSAHLLDASQEAHEARVEAGARAIYNNSYHPKDETEIIRLVRGRWGYIPTWEQLVTEAPENCIATNCRAKSRAVLASAGLTSAPKATK